METNDHQNQEEEFYGELDKKGKFTSGFNPLLVAIIFLVLIIIAVWVISFI